MRKMMATTLTQDDIKSLKGRGWLLNKGTDTFSARVLTVNGKLKAEELRAVADAAAKFGSGDVTFTSRQSIEVLGVPASSVDAFEAAIAEKGLLVGGTGPRVRPVVACKGTVCPRGLVDTFSLSQKIHERFYLKWHDTVLPGKFKIGVGGCPNNCVNPNLNDIGIVGAVVAAGKFGFKVALGGHWGRTGGAGVMVPTVFETEEEVLSFIEKVLCFYRDNGKAGERFFKTLERIGFEESLKMIG